MAASWASGTYVGGLSCLRANGGQSDNHLFD
jgi:hypothetical protein